MNSFIKYSHLQNVKKFDLSFQMGLINHQPRILSWSFNRNKVKNGELPKRHALIERSSHVARRSCEHCDSHVDI